MNTKTSSLTIADWAKKPEDVVAGASIIAMQTASLHEHLNGVAVTTKDIVVAAVLFIKTVMQNPRAMQEFMTLARIRGVTPPKDFDPKKAENGTSNPWLFVSRALIGETVDGKWMPSVYAAKNLPGVLRWLAKAADAEMDADGITTVLENAKTQVGKNRIVRGVEAAKALDRDANGKQRGKTRIAKIQVPREADRLKPIATFKANHALFPVDKNGYGLCTIRLHKDGSFGIYFGVSEEADVAELIAEGYEEHKDDLQEVVTVTKSLNKSNFARSEVQSANV